MDYGGIAEGTPYKGGILGTNLPEGFFLDWDSPAEATLRVQYNNPTKIIIPEIDRGKFHWGLLEKDGILFFLFKFGKLDWVKIPYRHDLEKMPYALIEDKKGFFLNIYLLNAVNGNIRAFRCIGLPDWLGIRVREPLEKIWGNRPADYEERLKKIESQYGAKDLARQLKTYIL